MEKPVSNLDIKNAITVLQRFLDVNNDGEITDSDFEALLEEADIN